MVAVIKKGHHRPAFWWTQIRPHFGIREMTRTVIFDSSCHYDWRETQTIKPPKRLRPGWRLVTSLDHWNKLFGWSDFFGKNSVRIGWRPALDGSQWVQLGAYLKEKGWRTTAMPEMDLGVYPYDEPIEITISHVDHPDYLPIGIIINNRCEGVYRFKNPRFGWLMHPYFGGQAKAPHDMKINVTK